MNLFQKTLRRENKGRPPVWFMRQAGRYHSHYQKLRKENEFMELCKRPELAQEVTHGPIDDFGFDAAILFSDLLFPLEALGMGLTYAPGPKLGFHLRGPEDLKRLRKVANPEREFDFQVESVRRLRQSLPTEKGLIGFVGGIFTLYAYAVEGSHQGELLDVKAGFTDGRWQGFLSLAEDVVVQEMIVQAKAGAEAIAVFDTCAGELTAGEFGEFLEPAQKRIMDRFKAACPDTPLIYYSKKTGYEHWDQITDWPIDCLGVDWNHSLPEVLKRYGQKWAIQGNFNSHWFFLPTEEFEARLTKYFEEIQEVPQFYRQGWVCGLGHGVLPKTPENHVRLFLDLQKRMFNDG